MRKIRRWQKKRQRVRAMRVRSDPLLVHLDCTTTIIQRDDGDERRFHYRQKIYTRIRRELLGSRVFGEKERSCAIDYCIKSRDSLI